MSLSINKQIKPDYLKAFPEKSIKLQDQKMGDQGFYFSPAKAQQEQEW